MTDLTDIEQMPDPDYVELTLTSTIKINLKDFNGQTREEQLQDLKNYLEKDPSGASEWFWDPDTEVIAITKENAND